MYVNTSWMFFVIYLWKICQLHQTIENTIVNIFYYRRYQQHCTSSWPICSYSRKTWRCEIKYLNISYSDWDVIDPNKYTCNYIFIRFVTSHYIKTWIRRDRCQCFIKYISEQNIQYIKCYTILCTKLKS